MNPDAVATLRPFTFAMRALTLLLAAALAPLLPAVASPAPAPLSPAAASPALGPQNALEGAWHTRSYVLKDGPTHPVEGMIFFTASDWSVLFFVVDGAGDPQRGSAEGGTYVLEGDALIFTHFYNASGGNAVAGLPASEWGMRINAPDSAPAEPCRIEVQGERLTIFFPSGNAMTFTRSS